ncbi:hypothetical protein [Candidatus Binatus sp.]|uniref:hypothetical protein n=1 Tax=Candidatus Binatus sp. TaxID=2811406 RepID=UPI003CC52288
MLRTNEHLLERFPENYARHLVELLSAYQDSGLAPPNLESEVAPGDDGKLWGHVWEAMLYRHLLNLGFKPQTAGVTKAGQRGPDFGIMHQGIRIWIEAVTPAPNGIPSDYLEPPKRGVVRVRRVPQEERLLRWTSVLSDKRKKLEYYRTQNIINATDCTVIAVNSCRLQDYAMNDLGISGLPFAVEAVFPIGPIAFPITTEGEPAGDPINITRYTIQKPNKSEVRTGNFLDPNYSNVSAIMGCWQKDMLRNGIDLTAVHNPLATVSLPRAILGANKEYVADQEGDHYMLRSL